ncbi:MAG: TIR domain-containing protein [Candidatus Aminicenantes bacterium]|nr:TIR domain-containing protein [Candidatus Aminicenantes bacterium]NIM81038.1 TIR domain-containing protein [Candidatus Aminicenantes bacterium]NIN20417.1 TIR domain-containing protein [Candidatus Aminicenantes bacterium]NIN44190.1 TIR domain-containing protein [Candidatus Aminicenantes bacterium]NIN87008.1 TIR domain-containing protein [Candidatus Aminicenantes bacterium]
MRDSKDYDVFISYSHLDSEPLFKDQEGWISGFHYTLKSLLGKRLTREPRIWHDKVLQGNDKFNDEIVGKLSNTKIFLAVISPCYLQSEWCMKELREFIKAAETRGGVHIGNKSRIFKIVKTLVPLDQYPDEIRELLGYEFFLKDDRGRPHECAPDRKAVYYEKYMTELENVAFDIGELILEMEWKNLKTTNHDAKQSSGDHKDRKPIYLEYLRKPPVEYSFEELDRELIARGAQVPDQILFRYKDKEGTPQRDAVVAQLKELYDPAASPSPNKALSHISTKDLVKILMIKAGKIGGSGSRGIWIGEDRMDFYDIPDEKVRNNAKCVAAVCMENSFVDRNRGFSTLRVKNYGKTLNLCDIEPFHYQPVASGSMCTGFLVKEDVVVTAAHFANENNVTALRFVFGYKMEEPYARVEEIPNENIYKGIKIIGRNLIRGGNKSDWALVKLDRSVEGQTVAALSKKKIFCDQPIYVIGHPCGLPLKYAPGASVRNVEETYFSANLDIYSDNAGSPVFDSNTHEVIGIVVHGYKRNFRWTGKCWTSIIYPTRDIYSRGAECTRVSEFIRYCQ